MQRRTALPGLVLSALLPHWAQAHHSIAHDFDVSRQIRLEGQVVRFQWMNPHCAIRLAVTRQDGRVETWDVEGGPPNALLRRGWTKHTLQEGSRIIVSAYPSRHGGTRANARDIELQDGRRLDAASSYLQPGRP